VVLYVISGFRHDVDEICALQGYYAALSGSCVPMFRHNLSVPSSRNCTSPICLHGVDGDIVTYVSFTAENTKS
jgi:hypothetical protein